MQQSDSMLVEQLKRQLVDRDEEIERVRQRWQQLMVLGLCPWGRGM